MDETPAQKALLWDERRELLGPEIGPEIGYAFPQREPTPKKNSRFKILVAGCVALTLAVGGATIYFIVRKLKT